MIVKALSLKQPWANMIVTGEKTIETRAWYTNYRGPLMICSSKKPAILPAGIALAMVNLAECRLMTKADQIAACCKLYPKAHSWVFDPIVSLISTFPVRGQLGIFDLEVPEWREESIRRIISRLQTPETRSVSSVPSGANEAP